MQTPTKNPHGSAPFQSPMSDQIRKMQPQELEICGAMRLYASPMVQRSPMVQQELQQLLEISDTGVFQEQDELLIQKPVVQIVTPTLKNRKTPLLHNDQLAVVSPSMPKSPSVKREKSVEDDTEKYISLSMSDFVIPDKAHPEEQEIESCSQLNDDQLQILQRVFQLQEIDIFRLKTQQIQLSEILERAQLFNKGCKNRGYCDRDQVAPSGQCVQCQARLNLETKIIKFIQGYAGDLTLTSVIELSAVQHADPELYNAVVSGEQRIKKEFGVDSLENLEKVNVLLFGSREKFFSAVKAQTRIYLESCGKSENYEIVIEKPVNLLLFLVTMLLYRLPPLLGVSLFQYIDALYSGQPAEKVQTRLDVKKQLDVALDIKFSKTNAVQFYIQFLREQPSDCRLQRAFQLLSGSSDKSDLINIKAFELFTNDLCRVHPGLDFLRPTLEFVDFYSRTVAYTVFYWAQQYLRDDISFAKFQRLGLTQQCWQACFEPDLNHMLQYFSYEHFYVIYCQFWQLDGDHDLLLTEEDMYRYGSFTCPYSFRCMCNLKTNCSCKNVYNPLVIHRLFQAWDKKEFSFRDFVNFIISEENKDSTNSIELFFELLDVDGDGALTRADYNQFWQNVVQSFNCYFRPVAEEKFDNLMCQITDAAHHTSNVVGAGFSQDEYITLDLIKKSKLCGNFFNIVVNTAKAIQFDIKDPYTIKFVVGAPEKNGFDRFCRLMYDLMDEADGQQEVDEPLDAEVLD